MNSNQHARFDSVILAGGFGKRLHPLTETLPKPMLPINNESAYVRNLKHLRKNGFVSTAVTTMYLPHKVEQTHFDDGYVEYLRETKPLGSAGAVAAIRDYAEECVLILSGDAVCDYDLQKAKQEFLDSGCDAAILLCHSDDSGEYGSVCVRNGIVERFCEKPSVRDTLSDLINTGIYFVSKKALDEIPVGVFSDFARDLFPSMLRKGMRIAGIQPEGMWFDIGSFGEYHQCNMWMSGGKNCIGQHNSIHPSAKIENSVIFDNCTIGNSVLRGCIIAENTVIGNDCIIPSGCVIGAGCELRDGVCLSPGTVLDCKTTLAGKAFINCFPKQTQSLLLDDDCVIASDTDDGYFVRLGRLLGGDGSIIAFAEGDNMTLPKVCEIAFGVSETGCDCTVVSGGSASLAAFAAQEYNCRAVYVATVGDKTEVRLFSRDGMPFSREELREISAKKPTIGKKAGSVFLLPHGALLKRYLLYLNKNALLPKKINVSLGKENELLRECASELSIQTDISLPCFTISADGERASLVLSDGSTLSYWHLLALYCIYAKKQKVSLPTDTPDVIERLLKRHSIEPEFYNDNDSPERKNAANDRFARDGVLLALAVSGLAERVGKSLVQMASELPPIAVTTRMVHADKDKLSAVITRIRQQNGGSRNTGFDFGDGRVSIYASASGRFRLVAEAVDSETAEEISLRAIDMLQKDS